MSSWDCEGLLEWCFNSSEVCVEAPQWRFVSQQYEFCGLQYDVVDYRRPWLAFEVLTSS